MIGKGGLFGFRAQAGGLRKVRAAHGHAGDRALQIHTHDDFNFAAVAFDGDLAGVAHQVSGLVVTFVAVVHAQGRHPFLVELQGLELGGRRQYACPRRVGLDGVLLFDAVGGKLVGQCQQQSRRQRDDAKRQPSR